MTCIWVEWCYKTQWSRSCSVVFVGTDCFGTLECIDSVEGNRSAAQRCSESFLMIFSWCVCIFVVEKSLPWFLGLTSPCFTYVLTLSKVLDVTGKLPGPWRSVLPKRHQSAVRRTFIHRTCWNKDRGPGVRLLSCQTVCESETGHWIRELSNWTWWFEP